MKYTVQFLVAGYGEPQGNDVGHYSSRANIASALERIHENAERYGAGYEPSEAVVWKGEHDDVTDVYPDLVATMGPRGGIHFSPC